MDKQFYFVICSARNYKVLATSEMYKTKQSCVKTATMLSDALGTTLGHEKEAVR